MNTWPISVRRDADRAYLGIPDNLGAPLSRPVLGTMPSLEETAGEDWTADTLRVLLPFDRAWAWCTQSSAYRRSGLPTAKAPPSIDPSRLDAVVSRCRLFHPSTLAFVPANVRDAQEAVLQWAGADTEQIPDHIWVASAADRQWNTDEIMDWCEDPARWSNLSSLANSRPSASSLFLTARSRVRCRLPPRTLPCPAWRNLRSVGT